jgi:hypothetical protein
LLNETFLTIHLSESLVTLAERAWSVEKMTKGFYQLEKITFFCYKKALDEKYFLNRDLINYKNTYLAIDMMLTSTLHLQTIARTNWLVAMRVSMI